MNLLNLSGGTWRLILDAIITLAVAACLVARWRDKRRQR